MASILLVDDNELVVASLTDLLEADGHDVIAHMGVDPAVAFIESDAHVDVALVDYWLAGETAEQVLVSLRHARPGVAVVLITGGSETTSVETTRWLGVLDGIDGFLQKPFLREDLRALFEKLGLGSGGGSA